MEIRYEDRTAGRPRSTDDLRSVAADNAFHHWYTTYEFYALSVEPLILQRGPRPLTEEQRGYPGKGYAQRWMAETSYSTTKQLGDTVRALGWYRQFREIILMFAISNIEPLCDLL